MSNSRCRASVMEESTWLSAFRLQSNAVGRWLFDVLEALLFIQSRIRTLLDFKKDGFLQHPEAMTAFRKKQNVSFPQFSCGDYFLLVIVDIDLTSSFFN